MHYEGATKFGTMGHPAARGGGGRERIDEFMVGAEKLGSWDPLAYQCYIRVTGDLQAD